MLDDERACWFWCIFASLLFVYVGLRSYIDGENLVSWIAFVGAIIEIDIGIFQIHIRRIFGVEVLHER